MPKKVTSIVKELRGRWRAHRKPVRLEDRRAVERAMSDGRPVSTDHITTVIRGTGIH